MYTQQEIELRDKLLEKITTRDVLLICRHILTNDQKNTNLFDNTHTWGPSPTAKLFEAIDHVLES